MSKPGRDTLHEQPSTSSTPALAFQTLVLEDVTPATRLLEKRRQVFEVQESLDTQKNDFGRKEHVFKKREDALKNKDAELQDSLIRFSKFLQENDMKRSRAERKAVEEVRTRQQKEGEIETLVSTLEQVQQQTIKAGEVAEKTRQYQRFLEKVLEHTSQHTTTFTEVNDILLRYATLEATNRDLKKQHKQSAEEAERARGELQGLDTAITNEVLLLNNKISRLKKELEDREKDVLVLSGNVDSGLQVASQKTLEHGMVCSAADNLYHLASERSNIVRPQYAHTLDQLNVIRDYISDLSSIVREGHRDRMGSR